MTDRANWKDSTNACLGLWLMISPLVVHGGGAAGVWNALLIGLSVLSVSLWAAVRRSPRGAEWTNILLGLWLIAAPSALHFTSAVGAAWNAWLVGLTVVGLAWAALATRPEVARA